MRSRARVVWLLVITLSTVALARPRQLLDEPIDVAPLEFATDAPLTREGVMLADYHGAAPVAPVRPLAPAPVVRHARADFFLIGLGLVGGGLVLGGAGFAVLYACYAGGGCSDGVTVLGWLLAAPGVIPLTVGLIMMYAGSGARVRVEAPKAVPLQRWAFGFAPLKEGGFVSASSTF